MPGKDERDPLDEWLEREVRPLPPPSGTFELITKRARRRKLGKLAVTLTSAASVAVAAVFAVPAVLSLHIGQSTTSGTPVAGSRPISTPASQGLVNPPNLSQGTATPTSRPPLQEQPSASPQSGLPAGGPVPANFRPASVTFIGADIGWVIGPGGTSGSCANANPTICTSVVLTDDGGQTWRGIHAPDTDDVTGIRFLNKQYGWAYGPQLWSTQDGGQNWTQVNTGNQQVIDLETAGGQAFALFASCAQGPSSAAVSANCLSYTLETTQAGSNNWSDVGQVTTKLSDSPGGTPSIVLSSTRGWLLATDGTIYSGLLGGQWTMLGTTPCSATPAPAGGALLTWDAYSRQLVAACESGSAAEAVYTSADTSVNWKQQPTLTPGSPAMSLATAPSAPAIVATGDGIYILQGSNGQWQRTAMLSQGFSYVGMTSDKQGVAVPANSSLNEVYMTYNGGQSWIPRLIVP
jgi:hypothetical protein